MIKIKGRPQVAGMFKLEAFRRGPDGEELPGSRRVVADWFSNLVTDIGLERMASTDDWLSFCRVGSGATAPNFLDTALVSQVAAVGVLSYGAAVAQSTPPYYTSVIATYRFAAGAAAGNLSEVGIAWGSSGATLFSRALILDSGGSPTTITVLSDEILDVAYQFRVYPPTGDTTGSVVLDGVTYDYVGRAAAVTNSSYWSLIFPAANVSQVLAYTGTLGAITGGPSGSTTPGASYANVAYSAGSHVRSADVTWGLSQGNLGGGIQSISYVHGFAAYQMQFTPAIPKDNTKVLTLRLSHAWARKTL